MKHHYPQALIDFINQQIDEIPIRNLARHIKAQHYQEYSQIIKLTPFLNVNKRFSERMYCIKENLIQIPKCVICTQKEITFRSITEGYHRFCSAKCNLASTETKSKFKQTCIEKLGVDNPMKSKIVQEKSKQTCMKKYGVDHNMKSPELLKKYQNIIYEKYGVYSYTQTHEYKEQIIQRKIKNNTLNIWANLGKNEKQILDNIEQEKDVILERQYLIGHYFVDGYDKNNNVIYEIYEKYHNTTKQQEYDKKRQKYIINKLQCKFVIIKDY